MSRIVFLTPADFTVIGNRNKTLAITVKGNVLVLYKQNDELSRQFEPVFTKLANVENRVTFAVLDVSSQGGREIVGISRSTTTPIQGTPTLILYLNGRPHTRFNGSRTIESIRNFISDSFQQATAAQPAPQQQFMSAPAPAQQNMYGGGTQRGQVLAPTVDQPSLRGKLKNTHLPMVEDEEEPRLNVPDDVIPYNVPWEAEDGMHI
jgi:hypothetical protein